jgi:predicted transcriptional regulator
VRVIEEALNLENRRKIFEFISKHPGTYLREMERELGLMTGVLSYHLDYMEKRRMLRVEDDGYRKRYFVSDRFRIEDRKTITVLRQPAPRSIVIHILTNGPSSFNQLQKLMECAKSTLSYHLGRMVQRGILVKERKEKENWYSIKDANATADLLISLRESLESDVVDRFAEIWEELGKK